MIKSVKIPVSKLALKRETVRSLANSHLETVIGGLPPVGTGGGGITPACQPTNPSERAQATCA